VLDAMNQVVYIDDCQVVKMQAEKVFGDCDRTYVKVKQIANPVVIYVD
jgi:Holliday junction resolvase RusA-like endonuclease